MCRGWNVSWSPGDTPFRMDASEKRDEWTGETEEKRDLDFAMRIIAHELYGSSREEVTSCFKSMIHGQVDFQENICLGTIIHIQELICINRFNVHLKWFIRRICRNSLFLHLLLSFLILFFPLRFQRGIIFALHLELRLLNRQCFSSDLWTV